MFASKHRFFGVMSKRNYSDYVRRTGDKWAWHSTASLQRSVKALGVPAGVSKATEKAGAPCKGNSGNADPDTFIEHPTHKAFSHTLKDSHVCCNCHKDTRTVASQSFNIDSTSIQILLPSVPEVLQPLLLEKTRFMLLSSVPLSLLIHSQGTAAIPCLGRPLGG